MNDKLLTNAMLIAVGYFALVKPITNAFGLTQSAEEKKDSALVDKADQTFLQPSWRLKVESVALPSGTSLMKPSDSFLKEISQSIYWAKGMINDDETAVSAACKKLVSKYQISCLSNYFANVYGAGDLMTYFKSYLNDDEINDLFLNYWNTLPTLHYWKPFDISSAKSLTTEIK